MISVRTLIFSLCCMISSAALSAADFDISTGVLTLPVLTIEKTNFYDVQLRLGADNWELLGFRASTTDVATRCDSSNVTLEKFNMVSFGMTYEQAIDIIGCTGELIAEGLEDGALFTFYHFVHGDSNFDLTFKDNSLVAKRQTIQ